jgi:hypothetical protein
MIPQLKNGSKKVNLSLTTGRRVWVKANPTYPNPFQDAFLEGEIVSI